MSSRASATRWLLVAACVSTAWACGGSSNGSQDSTIPGPIELGPIDSTNPTLPPETEPPTTTEPAGPPHIEFAFSGDVLIHSQLYRRALDNTGGNGYDFTPMFAAIKPFIESVDYAICHLEVPTAPVGQNPSTFPLYGAPSEILDAVAGAGYDRCSTASNHTVDGGVESIDTTVSELERVGISQAGMARTPAEIEPTVIEVNGLKVSHLSYTYGLNDLPLPAGEPWRTALIDIDRILADARTAREMGAEAVIVSMHWGSEGSASPNDRQRTWATQLAESGLIDLIVGSHPHVLQPIELIGLSLIHI